jgi:ribulose kinase
MKTKSQEIREALAAGDHVAALRTNAHFHDGSSETKAYKRGYDAYNHPDFYRQLGQDTAPDTKVIRELVDWVTAEGKIGHLTNDVAVALGLPAGNGGSLPTLQKGFYENEKKETLDLKSS